VLVFLFKAAVNYTIFKLKNYSGMSHPPKRNKPHQTCISLMISKVIFLMFIVSSCNKDEKIQVGPRLVDGDFYVSTSGNDNNPGTKDLPWKTLQKAADNAKPGQTVVVKEGDYNEYVTITNSGTSNDKRIIFFAEAIHGSSCLGFKIQGSYITIDGFDVEADGITNWTGIYIDYSSYVDVINCFVHECPIGGIRSIGTENNRFINNILDHNGQCGISLIGSDGLIEGNEIYRSVQYHPKGNEPGFTGADADGLRIFGDNHTIRGNIVENIADPADSGNIDPHSDCIQTWDGGANGRPIMTNTIIEGNFFSVSHPSGKGIIITALNGNACHHIIVRNNIIEFSDIGISAYNGEYHDIFVYNNIFKAKIDDSPWGTSVSFKNIENYSFVNNITVDCHPEHRHIVAGNGIVDYNIAWNSDGSLPTLLPAVQAHEMRGTDPKFVTYTGNHGQNDYHLQVNSPAINSGVSVDGLLYDFDSISRPQGQDFDIGAFEYIESN
jgi:parallel beta-helix repeat protein